MAAEKREIKQGYLAQSADLQEFAGWSWPLENYLPLIAARSKTDVPRALLVEELTLQNQHLPSSAATLAQIQKLADSKTFTVTTGHQVCLLGGPMFTLYKIATTIALARNLKAKFQDFEFVPVLWMATEDHDWEEVNHCYLGFDRKVVYPGSFKGPVGRHVLGEGIQPVLGDGVGEAFREFYQPGKTMAEAFRGTMHHLFGQHGLVILDADRPQLKRVFAPILELELRGRGVGAAVRASTSALEALGYKTQIMPRDINLFHLGEGGRSLIDLSEGVYRLRDGSQQWTEAEILAEVQTHPEHFSPNVALRPLYQETLLPNLAYVGGWAEVSYWLQLKAGFEAVGAFFPQLVPRMHATIFTGAQAREWSTLGFSLPEILEPLHVLNDRHLMRHWNPQALDQAILDVSQSFDRLAAITEALDPTLAAGIKAEQARSNNAFESLQKKVRKSLRGRNPGPYQRIAALKNAIEPENNSQQRVLNFNAMESIDPLSLVSLLIEVAQRTESEYQWITLH